MSQFDPVISVIISTYDDRALISKKIAEIQAQTYFEQAEFIFIESESPGKERELITPFCDAHSNCRLIGLDHRITLYQAWNLGWENARAPYVCITNMDDAMHPSLLEETISHMDKRKLDVASVLIAKQKYDDNWNSWEFQRLRRLKLITRPGPFFAWRRELKNRLGMFDEELEIVADKDFWARIVASDLKYGIIPKVLYLHTCHTEQLSKAGSAKEKKEHERGLCQAKGYRHEWPAKLRGLIRAYRVMRRIPFLRTRLYGSNFSETAIRE